MSSAPASQRTTSTPSVVLLGPQRQPRLNRVIDSLQLTGGFATITAGWQERESDDGELHSHLPGEPVNLHLWQRLQAITASDGKYREAYAWRRDLLTQTFELYSIGVRHALAAFVEFLERSDDDPEAIEAALGDAEEVLKQLDERYLTRVRAVHDRFYTRLDLGPDSVISRQRAEVNSALEPVEHVVIAGGHVGELLDALHLFDLAEPLADRTVIAWSAGAMALTDRVVLFNDHSLADDGFPQVYDAGLTLAPGIVALPSAHQRLATHDTPRMASLARRFAPATCVPLNPGVRVDLTADRSLPPEAPRIGTDGVITQQVAS